MVKICMVSMRGCSPHALPAAVAAATRAPRQEWQVRGASARPQSTPLTVGLTMSPLYRLEKPQAEMANTDRAQSAPLDQKTNHYLFSLNTLLLAEKSSQLKQGHRLCLCADAGGRLAPRRCLWALSLLGV